MTSENQIVEIMQRHIKVDATGLAPAVVGHHIFGFDKAANEIVASIARTQMDATDRAGDAVSRASVISLIEEMSAKHGNKLGSEYEQGVWDHGLRLTGKVKKLAALPSPGNASGSSDARREQLETERNRLDNSFGRGRFRDGLTRDRIAEIDAELAALPPTSPALRASGGVTEAMVEIALENLSMPLHLHNRKRMRAALEAASLSAGWRPIDEAPKGVKLIGGYYNPLGKWRTVLAKYYEANTLETSSDFDFDPDAGHYAPAGWYEESETAEEIQPIAELTHFLPLSILPSPPEKSDDKEAS